MIAWLALRPGRAALAAAALAFAAFIAAVPARAVTIEKVTSPGGITAWLVEDHSLPVVSLNLAFRGGAALDPADKAGLATLAANLLDEGAGNLDSSAFQAKLEDLASAMDFGAGEDSMGASLRTLTANVGPAFDLLHLALTKPRFDPAAVNRVRSQTIAALQHDANDPHYIANRLWWKNAFQGHPYAEPVRGTPDTVARITIDDLHAVVRDRFARDVLLIGVVGDITAADLRGLLDKTFGDLPEHAREATVPEATARGGGDVLLARMPIPQSVVAFGQPGIKRNDPDWYAALLVDDILGGGGLASRLSLEVREKRGLAYSVYTGLDPLRHGGVIIGGVATENARLAQSLEVIRAQWKRMQDEGPTAAELAAAKTYLTGSFPLSLSSTGRIAGTLVAIQRDELGIDYLDKRAALIDSVTLDDAKRAAKRLLDPGKLSFVVVGAPTDLQGAREVPANGS